MKKPTILIINDDGINAPGLKHLWKSVKDFCNPVIVAPESEQSGVGVSISLRHPLHVDRVDWEENTPAWKVSGTPADCVRIAVKVLLDTPPDLIISGINKGGNQGRNLLYSGTVGGIIDGVIRDIPGIAFSCKEYNNPGYAHLEPHVFPLIAYLLSEPLPKGSFLNVTFPSEYLEAHKGYRFATQGMGYYNEKPLKGIHPEGRDYYWMGCGWSDHKEHEESDVSLLEQGYITVVPIQVSELTHTGVFTERKGHFDNRFQLK